MNQRTPRKTRRIKIKNVKENQYLYINSGDERYLACVTKKETAKVKLRVLYWYKKREDYQPHMFGYKSNKREITEQDKISEINTDKFIEFLL